jgi:hypothetical protein
MINKILIGMFVVMVMIFSIAFSALGATDYYTERSFLVSPGGTVKIDTSFQEIEVTVTSSAKVNIICELSASGWNAQSAIRQYKPVFQNENDMLQIRSKMPGFHWTHISGKIQVQLPAGLNLDLHTASGNCSIYGDLGNIRARCDLSSGNLRVDGALQELSTHISSGDTAIKFTREPSLVTLDSSSGSIRLSGPAPLVKLHSSSGNVDLSGLTGSLTADLSSGNLTAKWDGLAAGERIEVHSSSGEIRFYLPENTKFKGDAGTNSGRVITDFPAVSYERGHLFFDGGDNSVKLQVEASSGDLRLLKN